MGLRNILLKDYREEVISKAIFEEIQKLEIDVLNKDV